MNNVHVKRLSYLGLLQIKNGPEPEFKNPAQTVALLDSTIYSRFRHIFRTQLQSYSWLRIVIVLHSGLKGIS